MLKRGIFHGVVTITLLCVGNITTFAKDFHTPPPPTLAAKAYILQEINTGATIVEHNADQKIEPASLTKMMTAYVLSKEIADGRLDPKAKATISKKARNAEGARMFLEYDSKVPISELLKGIIIQSGNDASIAAAEYVAGSEEAFVGLMNMEAQRLQMNNTHYMTATGLPFKGHYSTARDLAILSAAMINDFPETYKLFSEKYFTYNKIKQMNRNQLLWSTTLHVDGIKTGYTETAGYCLAASAVEHDMRLVAIMIGAKSEEARANLTQNLLHYGIRFYKSYDLFAKNTPLNTQPVWFASDGMVSLGVKEDIKVTIPKAQYNNLHAKILMKPELKAPIHKNQKLGEIVITLNNNELMKRDLVALNEIKSGSMWSQFKDYNYLLFSSLFKKDKIKSKVIEVKNVPMQVA